MRKAEISVLKKSSKTGVSFILLYNSPVYCHLILDLEYG